MIIELLPEIRTAFHGPDYIGENTNFSVGSFNADSIIISRQFKDPTTGTITGEMTEQEFCRALLVGDDPLSDQTALYLRLLNEKGVPEIFEIVERLFSGGKVTLSISDARRHLYNTALPLSLPTVAYTSSGGSRAEDAIEPVIFADIGELAFLLATMVSDDSLISINGADFNKPEWARLPLTADYATALPSEYADNDYITFSELSSEEPTEISESIPAVGTTKTFADKIIGTLADLGYTMALIPGPYTTGPSWRWCIAKMRSHTSKLFVSGQTASNNYSIKSDLTKTDYISTIGSAAILAGIDAPGRDKYTGPWLSLESQGIERQDGVPTTVNSIALDTAIKTEKDMPVTLLDIDIEDSDGDNLRPGDSIRIMTQYGYIFESQVLSTDEIFDAVKGGWVKAVERSEFIGIDQRMTNL